jgi:hypothetical protein
MRRAIQWLLQNLVRRNLKRRGKPAIAGASAACHIQMLMPAASAEPSIRRCAMAWMLLLLALPVAGLVIYVLFGRDRKAFSRERSLARHYCFVGSASSQRNSG